jgi:hypothetical protein
MRQLLLALGLALVLVNVASSQPEDECAAERDHYIALASHGPPQDQATFDELAAALDALFTCHNAGVSIHDFGDVEQFFVAPTPTVGP